MSAVQQRVVHDCRECPFFSDHCCEHCTIGGTWGGDVWAPEIPPDDCPLRLVEMYVRLEPREFVPKEGAPRIEDEEC